MLVSCHSRSNKSISLPPGRRPALGGLQADLVAGAARAPRRCSPPVDLGEDEKRCVIAADIPEIDPSPIGVRMDKSVLGIRAAQEISARAGAAARGKSPQPFGKSTRVERARGSFQRQFSLRQRADAEGITAIGAHRVREISLPKKALAAPRRITINSGH